MAFRGEVYVLLVTTGTLWAPSSTSQGELLQL
uniref:Uncharacterized protein n=1 Tax=Anguilla anguilla TaxID=7936 RepID=A0A0E9RD02_ANGAN